MSLEKQGCSAYPVGVENVRLFKGFGKKSEAKIT